MPTIDRKALPGSHRIIMVAVVEVICKKPVAIAMNCAHIEISDAGTKVIPAHVFEPVVDPALHALGGLVGEGEGHYGGRIDLLVDEVVDDSAG